MKIVFIEPKSPNLHIFSHFGLPRLGCVLLGTIARGLGHEVKVFVEEVAEIAWEDVKGADLVGVSTITSTAPRAYAIADKARRMGRTVVIGGPHATYMDEEAAGHADYVLVGEAEETFVELLEHVEGKRKAGDVRGMVRTRRGRIERTEAPAERVDIEKNPIPDFSLIRGFGKAHTFINTRIVPVQVSRGCPFDCSFCSVTGMFGRKMRYRSTASVMKELSRYDSRSYHIFFYDDNFAASPARAKELLRAMRDAGTKFGWSTQMRVDAARDPELLGLMRATHCDRVYVGVESSSAEVLAEAHKCQKPQETRELLLRYNLYGIDVHGMFVLGFDADRIDSWKETVRYARSARISTIQALILTPLPGSRVFREMEAAGRILFRDWSLYDSHHVVFRHPTMSTDELQKAQIDAHRRFYSNRKILGHLVRRDFANAAVAVYARGLQTKWKKRNALYMKAIQLLKPSGELAVCLDLRLPAMVD